eukprot:COSAG01_NODE_508_length_16107_cov_120.001187_20_plen_239_part_00
MSKKTTTIVSCPFRSSFFLRSRLFFSPPCDRRRQTPMRSSSFSIRSHFDTYPIVIPPLFFLIQQDWKHFPQSGSYCEKPSLPARCLHLGIPTAVGACCWLGGTTPGWQREILKVLRFPLLGPEFPAGPDSPLSPPARPPPPRWTSPAPVHCQCQQLSAIFHRFRTHAAAHSGAAWLKYHSRNPYYCKYYSGWLIVLIVNPKRLYCAVLVHDIIYGIWQFKCPSSPPLHWQKPASLSLS